VCKKCQDAGCDPNAFCPGGTTCGGCMAGYVGDSTTCVLGTTKLATVRSAQPGLVCPGYAYSATTCSECANLGAGTALTGLGANRCAGNQSPCCNLPIFRLDYANATSTAYPYMEFNVVSNAAQLSTYCATGLRLTFHAVDGTTGCNSPNTIVHVIETLNAADWDSSLTFNSTATLQVRGTIRIEGQGQTGFKAGQGTERFFDITEPAHLQVINDNLKLNNGKVGLLQDRLVTRRSSS